jgi:putative transposase
VKYACIEEHREEFPLTLMCRVLDVSRSGFHAWRTRPQSERARNDERLLVHIRASHARSRGNYGSPRVHEDLKDAGERTSEKRVARLMREDGLQGKQPRKYAVTTDSRHAYPVAENVLNRQFAPKEVAGPDCVWVSDITYVPTREGWLYLAVVIDLATRLVVGWSMGESLHRSLVLGALHMALQRRQPKPGLLHHSDRGVQYACGEHRALLTAFGITASMSRKGNCWDNAVAESFFATLERELIDEADWATRDDASRDIFEFIEVWYNRQRRHSTLGYQSPAAYEEKLRLKASAA